MREYKFKGKDEQGKWHFGSLVVYNNGTYAIAENDPTWTDDGYHNDDYYLITVRPDTVGQFTGLLDKNGKEICEGDIVETEMRKQIAIVSYSEGAFNLNGCPMPIAMTITSFIKVIGNIHDNPELKKGGVK